MSWYYLAVDIGTSSEHHMLACIQERKIKLEEIYHFENEMKKCIELDKILSVCLLIFGQLIMSY